MCVCVWAAEICMRDEWRGEQKKATATRPSLIKIVTFPVPFADRGVACATRVIAPRRSADKKNEAAHATARLVFFCTQVRGS